MLKKKCLSACLSCFQDLFSGSSMACVGLTRSGSHINRCCREKRHTHRRVRQQTANKRTPVETRRGRKSCQHSTAPDLHDHGRTHRCHVSATHRHRRRRRQPLPHRLDHCRRAGHWHLLYPVYFTGVLYFAGEGS
jgi:hypothetical protein